MMQIKLKLLNAEGLHARPAGLLAKTASQYQSKIDLKAKGLVKNAKSIMGVMALGLEKGDELEISADGADEAAAVGALQDLIEKQFAEGAQS